MEQLDARIDGNVIFPLMQTEPEAGSWEETVERVKKAIKDKVFESFKNGKMMKGGGAPANLPTARRYPVPMRQR